MRRWLRWSLAGAAATAAVASSARYAGARWQRRTYAEITRLIEVSSAARQDQKHAAADVAPVSESLPDPVRRFLRRSLGSSRPTIAVARLRTTGTFRQILPGRPAGADTGWVPFTADQVFTVDPPGFVWDARMRMYCLPVVVRDAYVAGRASMEAALGGLVRVVAEHGTPELAVGALLRYLAEAAWFPTALLPGERLRWSPIDDARARATLRDGAVEVSADFEFSPDGDIVTVSASRFLYSATGPVTAPWQGRFLAHAVHDGVRVPQRGEVAWFLDGEWRPYWRGRMVELRFEPATGARRQ